MEEKRIYPKTSFGALWTPYGGFWNEMRNNIT